MSREELLQLTRELRRRVEQGHDSDWLSPEDRGPRPAPSQEKTSAPDGPRPTLTLLEKTVSECRACPLGSTRIKPVFGVGSPSAQVMFVGEGPGFEEDRRGEPFVGPSGQLLDKILAAIGLSRETVYIANIVKCHPMRDPSDPQARGNDRPPSPEEIAACRGHLDEQIRLIAPKVIVTLGGVASRVLLDEENLAISRARGQWREYSVAGLDRPVKLLPTYHPAALLRDPDLKKDVWTDMKNLKKELDTR